MMVYIACIKPQSCFRVAEREPGCFGMRAPGLKKKRIWRPKGETYEILSIQTGCS